MDRRIRIASALEGLCKIIVTARVRRIQLYRFLKVLRSLFEGFFLVTQNAEMKMG